MGPSGKSAMQPQWGGQAPASYFFGSATTGQQVHLGMAAGGFIAETQPPPPPEAEPMGPSGKAGLKLVRQKSCGAQLKANQFEKCPICLDGLHKEQHVQTLPCFHRLHTKCCNKYFR